MSAQAWHIFFHSSREAAKRNPSILLPLSPFTHTQLTNNRANPIREFRLIQPVPKVQKAWIPPAWSLSWGTLITNRHSWSGPGRFGRVNTSFSICSELPRTEWRTFYSHSNLTVTIPPWGPSTARTRHQEGHDEEELLRMQATSGEEEQEDYELEPESWQISCLVSTDTFGAGHDTGDIRTGRMKIMWQPLACGLYPG